MAETTLYQLASQGPQQMMSYILRTKSGKLAVIDGGNHLDTDYLLEFLRSISQGKPVVEAWFLTHAHSDHVDAFLDIQREHAGEVDIRHVYYRFPDEGFIAAYEPGDVHTIREWNDLLPRFERLCVPVEEGQRIQVEELLSKCCTYRIPLLQQMLSQQLHCAAPDGGRAEGAVSV